MNLVPSKISGRQLAFFSSLFLVATVSSVPTLASAQGLDRRANEDLVVSFRSYKPGPPSAHSVRRFVRIEATPEVEKRLSADWRIGCGFESRGLKLEIDLGTFFGPLYLSARVDHDGFWIGSTSVEAPAFSGLKMNLNSGVRDTDIGVTVTPISQWAPRTGGAPEPVSPIAIEDIVAGGTSMTENEPRCFWLQPEKD